MWPELALQPDQELLGYTPQPRTLLWEISAHTLCGGMIAWGGKVRKLPQEGASKHQKFQPEEQHVQGLEDCFGWALTIGPLPKTLGPNPIG